MFLFSAPLVFPCLGGKVAQYGVGKKKSFFHGRGRREHSLYDLSQQIYSTWEKKNETSLLEADVDTVSVCWRWEELTQSLQLQRGIDGSQGPCDGSPSCERTAEAPWNPKWSESVMSTCKEHQGLSLFGIFFFSCRIHTICIVHIILSLEDMLKSSILKILQCEEYFKSTMKS